MWSGTIRPIRAIRTMFMMLGTTQRWRQRSRRRRPRLLLHHWPSLNLTYKSIKTPRRRTQLCYLVMENPPHLIFQYHNFFNQLYPVVLSLPRSFFSQSIGSNVFAVIMSRTASAQVREFWYEWKYMKRMMTDDNWQLFDDWIWILWCFGCWVVQGIHVSVNYRTR